MTEAEAKDLRALAIGLVHLLTNWLVANRPELQP
jgi:hypothetical protein